MHRSWSIAQHRPASPANAIAATLVNVRVVRCVHSRDVIVRGHKRSDRNATRRASHASRALMKRRRWSRKKLDTHAHHNRPRPADKMPTVGIASCEMSFFFVCASVCYLRRSTVCGLSVRVCLKRDNSEPGSELSKCYIHVIFLHNSFTHAQRHTKCQRSNRLIVRNIVKSERLVRSVHSA